MKSIVYLFLYLLFLCSSCVTGNNNNDKKESISKTNAFIPKYATIKKQEYPNLNKNSYDIIIPEAYKEEQLKAIIYDLSNDNGRNVFATIQIEGMSKASMAYAVGQILDGKFTLNINMDFTEYPEEDHPSCTVIGQWVVYGSDTYVIYEKDKKYYGVFASKGKWGDNPDELKKYKQNGYDTYEIKENNDDQEYMEIREDGLHIDSKIEPGEAVWVKIK